jgi:hypothetical protein
VALAILIVVLILIVIGVHSCQVSQANSDLRDYAVSVNSVMQSSQQVGQRLFTLLSSGQGSGNASNLESQVDTAHMTATGQVSRAQNLSTPGQLQGAQQNLVLSLQMRADGISNIARELPSALQARTASNATTAIAAEMARFYASDVLYKDYTLPKLISTLRNAGIAVGGTSGEPVFQGQFLPDVQWLTPAFVATELRAPATPSSGKLAPGSHGHMLSSVSVGGVTLQTGATNTVPAHPAPTFTLNFSNSGQNSETNVTCKVSVNGTSISGTKVVPSTTAGQSYTCQVTLNSSPTAGSDTVTATIEPVPGEKNTSNNTLTFPVTFQ